MRTISNPSLYRTEGYRQLVRLVSGPVEITENEIAQGTVTIDSRMVENDVFQVGTAISDEVHLTLDNSSGIYTSNLVGVEFELYLSAVPIDGSVSREDATWDKIGTYIIMSVNKEYTNKVSVVMNDRMVLLDKVIPSGTFSYDQSLYTILTTLCNHCGITPSLTVAERTFLQGLTLKAQDASSYSGMTCRDYIRNISEIMLKNAYMTADGNLAFRVYNQTYTETTPSTRFHSDIEEEVAVGPFVLYNIEGTALYTYGSEDGQQISLRESENSVVGFIGASVLESYYTSVTIPGSTVIDKKYRPMTITAMSYYEVTPGDTITYVDGDGNEFTGIVTSIGHVVNGSSGITSAGATNQEQLQYIGRITDANRIAIITANKASEKVDDLEARADSGEFDGKDGATMRPRGAWASGQQYVYDSQYIDVVTYNGNSYMCIQSHNSSSVNPANPSYWQLVAQKGEQGQQGGQGPQGDAGPEAVVTVYPTNVNWDAGTATLAVTLRVNGTVTTPTSYKWTKGVSETSIGTSSTLNVLDLDAVYNCSVAWDTSYQTGSYDFKAAKQAYELAQSRVKLQDTISASSAMTEGKLVCGTSSGYRDISAEVSFDLSYPILYCGTSTASGATCDDTYLAFNGVNASSTGTIESGAAKKTLYLKGSISNNSFVVSTSPFLTTVIPDTESEYYYISLGVMYSTTNIYFNSTNRLYTYINGAFQAVDAAGQILALQSINRLNTMEPLVESHSAQLNVMQDSIMSNVEANYTRADEFNTYVNSQQSSLEQLSNSITAQFSESRELISSVNGALETYKDDISKYIRFSAEGIEIGEEGNALTLKIDNDEIGFYKEGNQIAYWDGSTLYTGNAWITLERQFRIGNFAAIPRSDGSVSWLKVGE